MTHRGLVADLSLAAFCGAMLALMWVLVGEETIPYHFLFLSLAIVYGFRVWPMGKTVVIMSAVTLATGLIFLRSFARDAIDVSELAEVVLMPMLVMAMVWHARRRERAMREVRELSEMNQALLEREHEFLRETSHAIRTPVTIARGYVDLATNSTHEDETAEYLEVIGRQLTRTETLSSRLLTLASLDSAGITHVDMIDVSALAQRSAKAWVASADRIWVADVEAPAWVLGDETAIDAALDAMIENARHFTSRRDVIRILCLVGVDTVTLGVADSGPGIDDEDRTNVFHRFWHRTPPDGVVGSGLGLAMVEAVAEAHGGYTAANRAPEGGALVTMTLPRKTSVASTPMGALAPSVRNASSADDRLHGDLHVDGLSH